MPTAPVPTLTQSAPTFVITGRPGVGLVSAIPWRVHVPAGEGVVAITLPALAGHAVAAGDELRWAVLPQGLPDGVADVTQLGALEHLWLGTAVGVRVTFTDGTTLAAVDQYGTAVDPDSQAQARRTWVDQWNLRRAQLDTPGRSISAVDLLIRARPERDLVVYVDALAIGPAPQLPAAARDRARITRGTHSTGDFSRGNNAPLVGVPHGCFYALPMTDANERRWVYSWHGGIGDDPRPRLAAVTTSHIPSPWIGDRGQFQVMPVIGADTSRTGRARAFSHDDEIDRPYLWAANLDGGVRVQATAGASVMAVQCSFPAGADAGITFDNLGTVTNLECRIDSEAFTLTGILHDPAEELRAGAPSHHVHVQVPGATGQDVSVVDGRLTGRVMVDGDTTVVVGLSTLDAQTAAAHVAGAGSFDELAAAAAAAWDDVLGTVTIEGATDDQQVSLASGLYRLFLFPTRQDEPVPGGTAWRSIYSTTTPRLRAAEIGPRPETGTGWYSATNGFWDTYRTAWPLLGVLTPHDAAAAAQGFVAHHLDSGWMPRWSAPAPADCMTGTTSDTVLADMVSYGLSGPGGLDLSQAYASAFTNATVPASDDRVGRKGLHPGLFRGFVSTATHEGLAWTLDAALNDWSTSRLARSLAAHVPVGEHRDQLDAEAEWFERRSLLYAPMFDPARGMFVGRDDDGDWRIAVDDFDPDDWGTDYTETNAWGTAVTVPHDGAGLVRLHGGEAGLVAMLDTIMSRPETGAAIHKGSYGHAIHEMTEARDCRMGMLALSNQPAHHIPFMYMHAGLHDRAHEIVGDALDRLFVGSDLGQGYPGDEDNGEMSAWWIFATIGLYPLVPASGTFVLLPPRVQRTVLRPNGGEPIEIVATGTGGYIAGVRINGQVWNEVSVPHSVLAAGARIEVELSQRPCGWASASRPVSASHVHGFTQPLRDVTGAARCSHQALIDDAGATAVALAAGESVTIELDAPIAVGTLMTVTADQPQPVEWALHAMVDGDWQLLDSRSVVMQRVRQTRVFRTAGAADVTALRWTATRACVLRQLEVFAP